MARNGLAGISHIPMYRDQYWRKSCTYLGFQCFTKSEIFDRLGYTPLPTLEKMHASRMTHRVVAGGNRCLTGDMRVQTHRGYVPANEVASGDGVACQSSSKIHPRKDVVVSSWESEESVAVYKLTTKRGYALRGNAEHPLWSREEYHGKQGWKTLDSLQAENWVALECGTDVWPESCSVTEEEAYFLGLMTGDGCWVKHDGAMTCDFDSKDTDSAARLVSYLQSQGITPHTYEKRGQNSFSVEWCSIAFKKLWASRIDLVKSAEKSIPEIVLRGTKQVVSLFLRGLFDADGCATNDNKVVFVTISKVLAKQVHEMLLKFGVYSSLYAVEAQPKWSRPSKSWRIQAGGSAARTFAYEIGFESSRKQARLHPEKCSKRVYWDKVISVERDGEEKVYGVTTQDTHTYVANGFLSHNSGKTYAAAWEIVPYLFWLNTCGWVVTTTYETGEETRRKIEDILIERAGMEKVLRGDNLKPWQFSYGSKTHTFVMGTGSWFQLKSADAPDSMHAVPLHWVLIDEAALLPWMLYDTRLVPRLIDYAGWILSIGTFEWMTGEWFEEYFDLGQVPNTVGVESWKHPTEDNFHIYVARGGETPEAVADKYHANFHKLRTTNPGVEWPLKPGQQVYVWNIDLGWLDEQRERVAPEVFAARYSAQRATSPYTVFPGWSIQNNISDDRCAFDPDLPVYLAIDPGGTYAAAAVQFKKFDDVGEENTLTKGLSLCVIDEVYFQSTVTTEEVYAACAKKKWWQNVARWPWPHWDKRQGVIDVTAHEQQRAWMHLAMKDDKIRQLHLTGRKVDVQAGIQTLQHYISTHSLYAAPHCTFTNLEMRRYHYPEPSVADVGTIDPRKAPNPVDEWNHLIKAITYLAVGMFGCYGVGEGKSAMKKQAIMDARKQEEGRKIMNAVARRYNRRKK